MIARPFEEVWFCCCRWWEVWSSCWGDVLHNSGDARCCSSLASVEPSITSPFLHAPILGEDFLWCIQHKMPVRAAPITNEANATAMAISRGTPTMTAWEEWCVGGRSSLSSGTTSLDFLSSLLPPGRRWGFQYSPSNSSSSDDFPSSCGGVCTGCITRSGPRKINCCAVRATRWLCSESDPEDVVFFVPWQDVEGSTHCKMICILVILIAL